MIILFHFNSIFSSPTHFPVAHDWLLVVLILKTTGLHHIKTNSDAPASLCTDKEQWTTFV